MLEVGMRLTILELMCFTSYNQIEGNVLYANTITAKVWVIKCGSSRKEHSFGHQKNWLTFGHQIGQSIGIYSAHLGFFLMPTYII